MQFAMIGLDRPNAVDDRMRLRPDHLKHLELMGDNLLIAGPFTNDKGEGVGTIVIIESESLDTARASLNRDPYVTEGLFDTVMIKPFKLNINKTRV
jgi:uncharacterized protein YciI